MRSGANVEQKSEHRVGGFDDLCRRFHLTLVHLQVDDGFRCIGEFVGGFVVTLHVVRGGLRAVIQVQVGNRGRCEDGSTSHATVHRLTLVAELGRRIQ